MVYEAASYRQSRVTEIRYLLGRRVGQGKETEVKWEERGRGGRQGKHVEWVRIGTVSQGSVCRELSASLSLLLCHRNLILKS